MNVKQPPRQRKGAYQRLMPISNSCPSWTSHFLTALTVKFTSRLNATKEYGGWRVNDSSVMRKARHSFSHSPPPFLSGEGDFHNIGAFFLLLLLCHDAVMESLPVNLLFVHMRLISRRLLCEGGKIDFCTANKNTWRHTQNSDNVPHGETFENKYYIPIRERQLVLKVKRDQLPPPKKPSFYNDEWRPGGRILKYSLTSNHSTFSSFVSATHEEREYFKHIPFGAFLNIRTLQ